MLSNHHKYCVFGLVSLIFSGHILAASQPRNCPDASVVKQRIHVNESDVVMKRAGREDCCDANGFPYHVKGEWESRDFVGQFGADNVWLFKFSNLSADSASDASEVAQKQVSTLRFVYGPTNTMGRWYCSYHSAGRDVLAWFVG